MRSNAWLSEAPTRRKSQPPLSEESSSPRSSGGSAFVEISLLTANGVADILALSRWKPTLLAKAPIVSSSRSSRGTSEPQGDLMKLTYDPRYNIAYIRFQEKKAEVESIRVSDEMIVDMAPDGTIYGIELLNANEQLRRGDMEGLVVINEATGERIELPLAM